MATTRLGIVGPGLIWDKAHKSNIEALGDAYSVAAFCGSSERSRKKVESEYPGTPFFTDYNQMLSSDLIDGVVVLTPIPLNPVVTIAGLKAGKDVFVEKPMATSGVVALEIVKLTKETGKNVFVLEQFEYQPIWDGLKQIIDSGEIGDIVMYNHINHNRMDDESNDAGGYGKTQWRIEPDFPLGMLFDGGIHTIAGLTKVFGSPGKVNAAGESYRQTFGDYDYVLMNFEHENGIRGVFSFSNFLTNDNNQLVVYGTKGCAIRNGNSITINCSGQEPKTHTVEGCNAGLAMWDSFAQCIANKTPAPYDARRAADDIILLENVDAAIKKGETLSIEYHR